HSDPCRRHAHWHGTLRSRSFRLEARKETPRTYGSLLATGGIGNPRTTFSYKSGGSPQSSRRRICTSVKGDSRACVCPLTSTTLTLMFYTALSRRWARGRPVSRRGCPE